MSVVENVLTISPAYNGFKIKAHYGGPADPAMIAAVETELGHLDEGFTLRPADELEREGLIQRIPLRGDYVDLLRQRVDIEAIRSAQLRVAYDAKFGTGQGIVPELLGRPRVVEIRHDLNPGMYGQAPEPIERNLEELEHRHEQLGEQIERVRSEWESKKADESVPGARPDPGDEPPPSEEREGETTPGGPG